VVGDGVCGKKKIRRGYVEKQKEEEEEEETHQDNPCSDDDVAREEEEGFDWFGRGHVALEALQLAHPSGHPRRRGAASSSVRVALVLPAPIPKEESTHKRGGGGCGVETRIVARIQEG
jgi:hypothetical protein